MTKTNAQAKTVAKTAKAKAPAKRKPAAKKAPAKKPATKKPATKADDTIVSCKPYKLGGDMEVTNAGGDTVIVAKADAQRLLDFITEGKSFAVLQAQLLVPKGKPQLARGVKAKDAPHSSKSVSDQNGKASNKADAATQKQPKAKASKAKATRAPVDAKYKWIGTNAAREGTYRRDLLDIVASHNSKVEAQAELSKHKVHGHQRINWRWMETEGYVQF